MKEKAYTKYVSSEFVTIERVKQFKEIKNNHSSNKKHINVIEEQMLNDFYALPPISVNTETNNVIDGIYRLKAYLNLVDKGELDPNKFKLRVTFIQVKEENEEQVRAEINIVR